MRQSVAGQLTISRYFVKMAELHGRACVVDRGFPWLICTLHCKEFGYLQNKGNYLRTFVLNFQLGRFLLFTRHMDRRQCWQLSWITDRLKFITLSIYLCLQHDVRWAGCHRQLTLFHIAGPSSFFVTMFKTLYLSQCTYINRPRISFIFHRYLIAM